MWQDDEEGHYIEHDPDSHSILFSCTNVGEDQMNQRVRILVRESKIPKTEEEYKKFIEIANQGVTEM